MNAEKILANIMRWWIIWVIWIVWATIWYNIVDQDMVVQSDYNVAVERIQEDWTVETSIKTINEALKIMWFNSEFHYSGKYNKSMQKLQLESFMNQFNKENWWKIKMKFEERKVWLKTVIWLSAFIAFIFLWIWWPIFLMSEDWKYNIIARNIIRKLNRIPEQIWMSFDEFFKKFWFKEWEIKELKKKTSRRRNLNSIELAQEIQKEIKKYNIK